MKKIMQTLAALIVVAMIVAVPAMAQSGDPKPAEGQGQGRGPGGPPPDPAKRVEMMTKELDLTADQQTKIKEILTKEADQMKPLREDQSMSREDRRAKMMEIRGNTDKAINAVLNADQQKKYKEMQDKMRQQPRPSGGGGPGL